jgi:hypothetical protein
MSESEPKSSNTAPPPDKPAAELSESEFLAQQAQAAKDAMAKAWSEITSGLGKSADPRQWAKAHPWLTMASATVAGFVAASTLMPSKEEQALKKLAAIERALHVNGHDKQRNGDDRPKEPGGLLYRIVQQVIGLIQPTIMAALNSHLAPPPQPPADGAGSGGPQQSDGTPYHANP